MWSYDVMVSISDFESGHPCSNQGRTIYNFMYYFTENWHLKDKIDILFVFTNK